MAARTRTLQQLQDGVAERADIAINTGRWTTTVVWAQINRAIQRWLLLLEESGDRSQETRSLVSTDPSTTLGANNYAPNEYVQVPDGIWKVTAVDLIIQGRPIALLNFDELERDDTWQWPHWFWSANNTGVPVLYRPMHGANPDKSNSAGPMIGLMPRANAVYQLYVYGLPAHVDLTGTGDTIDFIAGGEEWVINDAALQVLYRDGGQNQALISWLQNWNAKIEAELRFSMAGRTPRRKVDTVEMRRRLRTLAFGPWRIF